MRYAKKPALSIFAIFIFLSTFAIDGSGQSSGQKSVQRPVFVRHYWVRDPFWSSRRWGFDPWYDPYFYDPYLREQRERYYKERAVKDAGKKLAKYQEKYNSDGVLTAKESRKLSERAEKYDRAQRKLDEFNRDSD